jgi:hypothetical protein
VREADICVIDNETGEEITPIVLSQILVDDQRENRGERDSAVSGTLLTELIQRGGDALYSLVRRGVGDVETNLNEMRDNVRRWIRTPADGSRFDTSEITQTVHSAVERVLRVADLPTRRPEALNRTWSAASALELRGAARGRRRPLDRSLWAFDPARAERDDGEQRAQRACTPEGGNAATVGGTPAA